MDVKAITLQYLKANGYDGLYGDDCACKLDDLFPCGYAGTECCQAGYLQAETPPEFDFCIGPDKPLMPQAGSELLSCALVPPEMLDKLPKLPEYKGSWWPVYWTPIMGSSERITAFVIAVGEDDQVCVRQAIRPAALAGMFGDKAPGLENMLRLMQVHIEAFLGQMTDFSQWRAVLTGFEQGERRTTLAGNIRQIAAQGICFEAALADPAFADLNQE